MSESATFDRRRHRVAVPVAAVVVLASLAGWAPSATVAISIAAVAATLGMPHGALDIVVGPRLISRHRFTAVYLVLGAATVAIWMVAPIAAVVVFFAMSWWHFGTGDAEHHRSLGASRFAVGAATAGSVIGLPMLLHSDVVAPILADLTSATAPLSTSTVQLAGAAICAVVVVTGWFAVRAAIRGASWHVVVELASIMALAALAHPLVAFAIYFACWHSPRHVDTLELDRSAWGAAVVASAGTVAAAAFAWWLLDPSTAVAAQVVFVGLSALTTPHLLITDLGRHASGAWRVRRPSPFAPALPPLTAPSCASSKA